jgi:Synergist-CTERM protein sorting domain-containing protein
VEEVGATGYITPFYYYGTPGSETVTLRFKVEGEVVDNNKITVFATNDWDIGAGMSPITVASKKFNTDITVSKTIKDFSKEEDFVISLDNGQTGANRVFNLIEVTAVPVKVTPAAQNVTFTSGTGGAKVSRFIGKTSLGEKYLASWSIGGLYLDGDPTNYLAKDINGDPRYSFWTDAFAAEYWGPTVTVGGATNLTGIGVQLKTTKSTPASSGEFEVTALGSLYILSGSAVSSPVAATVINGVEPNGHMLTFDAAVTTGGTGPSTGDEDDKDDNTPPGGGSTGDGEDDDVTAGPTQPEVTAPVSEPISIKGTGGAVPTAVEWPANSTIVAELAEVGLTATLVQPDKISITGTPAAGVDKTFQIAVVITLPDGSKERVIVPLKIGTGGSGGETPGGETPGGETPGGETPTPGGDEEGGSGSSGGCDAGFGALALAAAAAVVLRKRS